MGGLSADRVAAFRRRAFGLFLHWGLYSQLGKGEWVWRHHDMASEDYRRLFDTFSADGFDADAWVRLAKEAGCRYVCLTTRHHEGFSLYDVRGLNDYDAPHAVGRDLVAEFAAACERHGVGKFFYHTTLDWWHPDFDGDWRAYQEYLRASVEILCRHYGDADGFWFDGNWARRDRDWEEDALYALIRGLQPGAVIVNNSSHGHHGEVGHPELDVVTYEQGLPGARRFADGKDRGGEMCETVNSHWGVGARDLSHKSPAELIERLAACRRHGANLLCNIGPEADGAIPAYEAALFRLVGRWTSICPEAIYDAEPTGLVCPGRDFVLRAGDTFYRFCHNVPIKGNRHLLRGEAGDGLQTIGGELPPISRVRWADTDEDLAFTQEADRLVFDATPHPYGSQLVVRVAILAGG